MGLIKKFTTNIGAFNLSVDFVWFYGNKGFEQSYVTLPQQPISGVKVFTFGFVTLLQANLK